MNVEEFFAERRETVYKIARECKAFMGTRMTLDRNQVLVGNGFMVNEQIDDVRISGTSTAEVPARCSSVWVAQINDETCNLNFKLLKPEVTTLKDACFKVCANHWIEIAKNSELRRYLLNLPSQLINSIATFTPSVKLQDPECLRFILRTSCTSLKLPSFSNQTFLQNFKNLTHLEISGCKIPSGPYLQLVRNLPNVRTLFLQSTGAFDEILGILAEHSLRLESLNLKGNLKVTDKGILDLCTIEEVLNKRQPRTSQIHTLEIKETKATEKACYYAMVYLPRLINLSFDGSFRVFAAFQEELGKRDSDRPFLIESLHVNHWFIVEERQITLAIRLCPHLTKLNVNLFFISPKMLPALSNFERINHLTLRYIDLYDTDIDYDFVALRFIKHFPSFFQVRGSSLRFLKLIEVPTNLNLLGRFCPNLIELHLKHVCYKDSNPPIVNEGKIFQNVIRLEVISHIIFDDFKPTKENLLFLLCNCTQLKHLVLTQVETMTPALLSEILSHNPMCSLESVVFNYCENINGECIRMLIELVPSLKQLKVSS